MRSQSWLCVVFCFVFLLCGCNSGPVMIKVHGMVTVDGQPAPEGLVQFEAIDGKSPSAKGGIISQGQYSAEVPPGEASVKIFVPKVVGKRKVYDTPDSPVEDVRVETLPSKYNSESTLKETISAERTQIDFKLSSK